MSHWGESAPHLAVGGGGAVKLAEMDLGRGGRGFPGLALIALNLSQHRIPSTNQHPISTGTK